MSHKPVNVIESGWRSHHSEPRERFAEHIVMKRMNMKLVAFLGDIRIWSGVLALVLSACAGVRNPHQTGVTVLDASEAGTVAGSGIESQDIVSISDYMARKILSTPQVMNAVTPPTIFVKPVVNNTRFPINSDIFTDYIQGRLLSQSNGKFTFLARENMAALEAERNLKREGALTSPTDPYVQEFLGADYILTGKLTGQSTRTSAGTSDFILYNFQLIDTRTSAIIWGDQRTMKKQSVEEAVYR